jgi:hypothetical protein
MPDFELSTDSKVEATGLFDWLPVMSVRAAQKRWQRFKQNQATNPLLESGD